MQTTLTPGFVASAAVVFLVSLVVGTVAIRLGAQVVIDRDTGNRRALAAALAGALAYTLVSYLLGWVPLLGPLVMLVAWVGVINWQYPGGWGTAAGIGGTAWVVAVAILVGLARLGALVPEAVGVPGV
ncbi:hypothetical protein ACFQRB_08790 [Halobaculum litoreum]|uniref:Uncharacterized protein n=1 Tax=Halobaculum litoreum TaxID=3031998 RepID=A0ABD5XN10_9EURY